MIRDRVEALIAAWPATNGDPPDTDYQHGYLAACEEHARELAQILAEGGPEPTVDALRAAAKTLAKKAEWARSKSGMRPADRDGWLELAEHLEAVSAWLTALPRPSDLEREERAHGVTIDQRDAAESALSEAYLIVTGQPPEWSNRFGYREALDDIRSALPRQAVVQARLSALKEVLNMIKKHRANWGTNPVGKGYLKVIENVAAIEDRVSAMIAALPRPAVDEGMRAALVRIREIAEASDADKLAATVALDDIADEVTAALAAAQEGDHA